jgi:hypothetical protein
MSKRPPMQPLDASDLNPEAFAGKTVPQPDPVKVATTAREPDTRPAKQKRKDDKTPPSRVGKVQIVAWTTEETRAKLKAMAALKRRSVDDILNAAITDILKKG